MKEHPISRHFPENQSPLPCLGPADWISSSIVGGPKQCAPAGYYRKAFHLTAEPQTAILTISARGIYEFEINGRRAHEDVFSPGWTDYRKRILVRSYDVTPHLLAGENVLGIMLGDGWYCGYLAAQDRQFYGDRPSVIASLRVIGTDGSEAVVVTDSSWLAGTEGVRQGDFFMGEIHDARLENPGWSAPGAALEDWLPAMVVDAPEARLLMAGAPPVKRMEVLPGKPLPVPAEAASVGTVSLWDIGENIAGRARLRFRGEPGRTVTIRYAEILEESGTPYFGNLRGARATDEYTFRSNEEEIWEPRFTFHGFRYVEIRSESEIDVLEVDGIVLHSAMQAAGTFACSDPDLNQLFRNILRSQKGNFLEVPTDCPQRDERLGWTADAQVFIRTATHSFDCRQFFLKWIDDLTDAQHPNGAIPPFAPDTRSFGLPEDGGAAWADAAFICPWTLYQVYGDSEPLAKAHAMMVRYMDYLEQHKVRDGIRAHPELDEWGGFGDWLAPERNGLAPGETPKDLIGTVFYVNNARILAATSQILGKSDAGTWSDLADRSAEAFRNRFLNPDGSLHNPTQTGCVLALHFNMLLPWQRQLVFRQLVERIEAHENHIGTGFVGTPYILHVLEAGGRLDLSYRLLLNTECPSWLYSVRHGATSIWERWDGWTRERGFADPGMNSYNHYAYGAVGDWLVRSVAGLELDAPGFSRILFKPRPGGGLTHASASYETRHGLAAISWKCDFENTLTIDLTVPAGTSARVDLGNKWATDGPAEFAAGTFRFTALRTPDESHKTEAPSP